MKLGDLAARITQQYVREVAANFKQALQSLYSGGYGIGVGYGGYGYLGGGVREPYPGAWQQNIVPESRENILAFSAVYACVALISNDISKLAIKLTQQTDKGTWEEVLISNTKSPFLRVLGKPNRYQTRQQFISQWITCKLLYGNAYILKERESGRGMVSALYCLDPRYVVPAISSDDGSVWYQVSQNYLAGLKLMATVPASEIIHDRMVTLWHPLVGVTPIYACGASATQGMRIQANSAKFFENMSMPSGQLTGPNTIDDVTAARMKAQFQEKFSGKNLGGLLVAGDGLKYEAMTIPAADSQLIEQLRWTVEDVARCFLVPDYKIMTSQSGRAPAANIAALNQDYYNQCLQVHIEGMELLLDEGLELTPNYDIELDLDGLLRMDPLSQSEVDKNGVSSGVVAPNEARKRRNLAPAVGGDEPFLQQQNYSLAALAKRDALADPFATSKTPAPTVPALPAPEPAPTKQLMEGLLKRFEFVKRLQEPESSDAIV